MPQRYQIHRQKAIQKFRHLVAEQNPTIQMVIIYLTDLSIYAKILLCS